MANTEFGPVGPQRQWLVLDTPGDSARVNIVTGTTTIPDSDGPYEAETMRQLCPATPCVVDVHVGERKLKYASNSNPSRHDDLYVEVARDPLVVRHVMAESKRGAAFPIGIVTTVLGANGILGGGIIAAVGAAQNASVTPQPCCSRTDVTAHGHGIETAGLATVGIGGGLVVLGSLMMFLGRGTHRAGATSEWVIKSTTTSPYPAP